MLLECRSVQHMDSIFHRSEHISKNRLKFRSFFGPIKKAKLTLYKYKYKSKVKSQSLKIENETKLTFFLILASFQFLLAVQQL